MRKIDKIILHCSATDNIRSNTVEQIRLLHASPKDKPVWFDGGWTRGKGWNDIGYHFFITPHGKVENGRRVEIMGAHCEGYNANSIGICLGGLKVFYPVQFEQLKVLVQKLCTIYLLDPLTDIYPHCFFDKKGKTCPNFDLKAWLQKEFTKQ